MDYKGQLITKTLLVYYDIGSGSTDTATVTFAFSATASTVRTWEIKVTQIECSNLARYTNLLKY